MKGRKPKPASMQIAAGDPRKLGKNKLQEKLNAEPAANRGLPEAPVHLSERAGDAWRFWVNELAAMNLDFRPDAMMLEGACVNYARAVEADILINRDGAVTEEPILDREGDVVGTKLRTHPAVAISNRCWMQTKAFCSEFGLSPVSRTRLTMEKNPDEEDLAKLLSQPRERMNTAVN